MGRLSYQRYDPYDLEFPNDTDFELEGIDEDYELCQEYAAYLPDWISQLRPIDAEAIDACQSALDAIAAARSQIALSDHADSMASLLLYAEAVSTVQVEDYPATCERTLDYIAASSMGGAVLSSEVEAVAMDAIDALHAFAASSKRIVTVYEVCDADALFARTSPRAEYCGELREQPVFIGRSLFDAEFVPPPADDLDDYMNDLVRFVSGRRSVDPIAKAAIAHAQFVTIHPFEDGNGRVGRALSQRVLCVEGVTDGFMLPTAAVVARRKMEYIDALRCMQYPSGPSDPSRFVRFFAECCRDAAHLVAAMGKRIQKTLGEWSHTLPTLDATAQKTMGMFVANPIMAEAMLSSALPEGVGTTLDRMISANILKRRRSAFGAVDVYVATDVLAILDDMLAH